MKSFLWLASLLFVASGRAQVATRPGAQVYEAKARPVLAARCLACHQGSSAAAGLHLDTPAGWGAVVRNGKLLKAVRHEPGVAAMPPTGARLSERELAGLTEWVRLGGPGPVVAARTDPKAHWAFQPLRPGRATIDEAVGATLAEHGLTFNPEADRRTWLRRVTLDLTGLPPTVAEQDAFQHDTTPRAHEAVVDRLLASPHFGEKWARHWLDLARFAESHGYEQDYDRPHAYTYRDFVIRAFNDDLPFTTFVRWQLAGDELAPENPQALFATGFLGAGTHATQITKSQVEKERYDELDDMLSVTSQAFLGLTVGCARCHDHKYDPIPTRDYYRMLATFTRTVRSDYAVPIDATGDRARQEKWQAEHAPLVAARETWERETLPARFAAWAATRERLPFHWTLPVVEKIVSAGGATITALPDGSQLLSGTNPEHETLTVTLRATGETIGAVRLEALAHPSLVRGGPGRASNGNFALSQVSVTIEGRGPQALTGARADFEQKGLPVAAAIDTDAVSSWAIDPQFGRDHAAVFALAAPVTVPAGTRITVRLAFNNNTGHGIGRLRLAVAATGDAPVVGPAIAPGPEGLRQWYKTRDSEWLALQAAVEKHAALQPKPTTVTAMICSEGVPAIRTHTQGGDFLETTHFLKRGDPNQKGEVATASFLSVLKRADDARWKQTPPPGARTSFQRAAFAAWLTDTEKGAGELLARVIVNRLWQRLYGRGIVATPSDFGTMGERPTHPALLDRLAADLIQGGWHLKPLLRRLVLTRTYRQSAAVSAQKARVDPDNRWLSRFARRRLEAENLRDAMLSVSGMLDPTLYGPGTLDETMRRRGIYFFVKRSKLVPFLVAFDGTNALQSIGARQTTTVAPQALILLNNPQARQWSAAFAARVSVPYAPAESVRRAYRSALAREPSVAELSEGIGFLNRGGSLTDLCQVLFSLNEFVYVE